MISLAYSRSAQRITCPHLSQVVPSESVTLTLLDSGGTALLSATASTGACSTTLSAAASAGARSLTLSSASDLVVGETIGITPVGGSVEIHVVDSVVTTTGVVGLRGHTLQDLSTADAVNSAWIYYDADLSDTDTYPVDIYYQARFACSTWDAVRSLVFRVINKETTNPITHEDIERILGHVSLIQDSYDTASLERPRTLAWEMLSARLLAMGRDPAVLKDTSRLAVAGGILAAALFLVGRHGGLDMAHELAGQPVGSGGIFGQHIEALLSVPAWYDLDQSGGRDSGEMTVGRSRLTRRGR